uniref:hypothetical protein n=1 Tax=Fodinicola feengrottensis TaxID=435914 RepID=UPI0036F21B16
MLPETVRRHLREELVCVPVEDAEPTRVMIGWPEGSHSPAVAAFVGHATKHATKHADNMIPLI